MSGFSKKHPGLATVFAIAAVGAAPAAVLVGALELAEGNVTAAKLAGDTALAFSGGVALIASAAAMLRFLPPE